MHLNVSLSVVTKVPLLVDLIVGLNSNSPFKLRDGHGRPESSMLECEARAKIAFLSATRVHR